METFAHVSVFPADSRLGPGQVRPGSGAECVRAAHLHVRVPYRRSRPAAGQLRVVVSAASSPEITDEWFRGASAGRVRPCLATIKSGRRRSVCASFRGTMLLSPLGLLHGLCTGRSVVELPVVGIRVNGRKRRKHLRRGWICVSSKMSQNTLPVAAKILLVPFVYR